MFDVNLRRKAIKTRKSVTSLIMLVLKLRATVKFLNICVKIANKLAIKIAQKNLSY